MIALLIILYLIIGLFVGTIVWWKATGSYEFEGFIEDMDISDFCVIFTSGVAWPIVLIALGLPALFRLIILVVMKMIEENRND